MRKVLSVKDWPFPARGRGNSLSFSHRTELPQDSRCLGLGTEILGICNPDPSPAGCVYGDIYGASNDGVLEPGPVPTLLSGASPQEFRPQSDADCCGIFAGPVKGFARRDQRDRRHMG